MKKIFSKWINAMKCSRQAQRDKEIVNTYDVTYNNGNIFILAGTTPVVKLEADTKVSSVLEQIEAMQEAARAYKD